MTDLDTHLRLQTAADQLLNPTRITLDRYRPEADPATAATLAEAQQDARRLAQLTTTTGEIPSLLAQLEAAVEGTGGTNGAPGAGAHRSPIGLEAAELLGQISRTVAHRTGPLANSIRTWAATDRADPDQAEHWVATARDIVNPTRSFEVRGACPLCGRRRVWTTDPTTGTRVRRAALQVSYATRSARCIAPGCTGHWADGYLDHLAAVVQQDRDERSASSQPA